MFPNPDNWITGNWGEDSVPPDEEEEMGSYLDDDEIFDEYVSKNASYDGLRSQSVEEIAMYLLEVNMQLDRATALRYAKAIKRVLAELP